LQGTEITIAAIGVPGILEIVENQRGEWEETRRAKAAIRTQSADLKAAADADVLIFPSERLGDLIDVRMLVVLPESIVRPPPKPEEPADAPAPSDVLSFVDLVKPFRDQVSKYGPDRMGLPLGGSALVVVYRRDAFESEANRKAAKEAGVELVPPQTWDQFDALAKFFHGRDWDEDGQVESGVALAWGPDSDGVADATFLARAAALGQHPHQFSFLFDATSMAPRIATPPFVAALEGLVALKAYGPPKAESFDAEAARAAFRSGEVALLIDRAERAPKWFDPKAPKPIDLAPLPGSRRVYDPDRSAWEAASPPNRPSYLPLGGGWLVGVSAASSGRRRDAAIDFALYLASPETLARMLPDPVFPMLPVRMSQVAAGAHIARAYPSSKSWTDAIAQTWLAPRVVPGLRIPDASGYLEDLAKARAEALAGQTAEQALKAAAQAWSERTKSLNPERQLWHYRRSLNTLATSATPPSR
jgi:multiple sugar transport system substrate-binding protein